MKTYRFPTENHSIAKPSGNHWKATGKREWSQKATKRTKMGPWKARPTMWECIEIIEIIENRQISNRTPLYHETVGEPQKSHRKTRMELESSEKEQMGPWKARPTMRECMEIIANHWKSMKTYRFPIEHHSIAKPSGNQWKATGKREWI